METRLADRLVVTRMDTSKLGWTPYVYYTTLQSTPPNTIFRQIYWARELFEKRENLGEIRVRDKKSFCKKVLSEARGLGSTSALSAQLAMQDGKKAWMYVFFERVLPAKGWKEFSFKN